MDVLQIYFPLIEICGQDHPDARQYQQKRQNQPSSKSSIVKTFFLRIGFGISSRGSRPGFLSSLTMSFKVITPISNSSANLS